MPTYRFKLNDDGGGVEDDFGVSLPNAEIAHRYACDVVHELMTHREQRTRHWRLDVYDVNGEKVFEIPFASVDHTLDHLTTVSRAAVEECAQHIRSLKAARYDASLTRRESRSLVAQSRGEPYLAADHGRKVIRDPLDDRQVIQQAREAVVDLEQVLFYSKQALDQSSELLRVIDKISSPLIRTRKA
jgi:hypothetical protein